MGLDLVKSLILIFTTNIFEACLLLYGIYFHQDWRMAILFPIIVPAIIAITLHKNKYCTKLLVAVVNLLSLILVQNAFALFWGDDGTLIGMMLFSFLFTFVPAVVYILVITIHWSISKKTGDGLREP